MSRYWTALPIVVMAGVPIWTMPSVPVIVAEGAAAVLCAIGVIRAALGPVTAGGVVGVLGYALATGSAGGGADAIGAAIFGIALLLLLDVSEFARRLEGAAISAAALRGQVSYWLGRIALVVAVAALLVLAASALSLVVPGNGKAIVAGIGAVTAFAGAVCSGVIRRRS